MKVVREVSLDFWLSFLEDLRKDGQLKLSDELREMLRRMGYEVKSNRIGESEVKK